jgi:DNA adenine methylase
MAQEGNIMPTTPSPLRYPGGKTAYAPMLRQIIKDNGLHQCEYIEPFAGGGGAALSLLLSGDVSRIWLNDLDYSIFAFWKAILEHTDAFIQRVRSKRVSIAEWKRQHEIYHSDSTDILSRGFATFYLNRCNRAGILAANPIGGLRQISEYKLNARFNKQALIQKIHAIADMKEQITVSNFDAVKFLRSHLPTSSNMLVYFDPPYYQKGGLLYLNHYTHENHILLSKTIRACKKPWLLSYDDRPEIMELYTGINIYRRGLRYSISTPSIGSELIISDLLMPESLECVA